MLIIHQCPELEKKQQYVEFYRLKEWHLVQKDVMRACWQYIRIVTECPCCKIRLDNHVKPFQDRKKDKHVPKMKNLTLFESVKLKEKYMGEIFVVAKNKIFCYKITDFTKFNAKTLKQWKDELRKYGKAYSKWIFWAIAELEYHLSRPKIRNSILRK